MAVIILKGKAMMPKLNSVGYEIAYHALGPALQALRNGKPDAKLVDVYLGSLLRQVRNWGSSALFLGRVGAHENIVLSEGEAAAIYSAFDSAFNEAFHGLARFSRAEASIYVEQLILDVGAGLKGTCACEESDKVLLQDFLAQCGDLLEGVEVRPIFQ